MFPITQQILCDLKSSPNVADQLRLIPKQTFSISTGWRPVCSEQTVPGSLHGGLQEGLDQTACELTWAVHVRLGSSNVDPEP